MNKKKTNVWMIIGAVVLIVLILMWQADAFSVGDTDVSATPLEFLGNLINIV